MAQFLQMETQAAIGFSVQMVGQIGNAQTIRACLNQMTKDAQPGFVGERLEGG